MSDQAQAVAAPSIDSRIEAAMGLLPVEKEPEQQAPPEEQAAPQEQQQETQDPPEEEAPQPEEEEAAPAWEEVKALKLKASSHH